MELVLDEALWRSPAFLGTETWRDFCSPNHTDEQLDQITCQHAISTLTKLTYKRKTYTNQKVHGCRSTTQAHTRQRTANRSILLHTDTKNQTTLSTEIYILTWTQQPAARINNTQRFIQIRAIKDPTRPNTTQPLIWNTASILYVQTEIQYSNQTLNREMR